LDIIDMGETGASENIDIQQFEGMHFRDAQTGMSGWTDEQLIAAARSAEALRDEIDAALAQEKTDFQQHIYDMEGKSRNWHQIGWAARELIKKRHNPDPDPEIAKRRMEQWQWENRSIGRFVWNSLRGKW